MGSRSFETSLAVRQSTKRLILMEPVDHQLFGGICGRAVAVQGGSERREIIGPYEIVVLPQTRPIPRAVRRAAAIRIIAKVGVFAQQQRLYAFLVEQRRGHPAA